MKNIKMQLAALILLCTILIAASCKKEGKAQKLPPETQTGAMTMGFKIDGKIYTASGKRVGILSSEYVSSVFLAGDSILSIFAVGEDPNFDFQANFKYFVNLPLNTIRYCNSFPFEASFQDRSNGTASNSSNLFTTDAQHQGRFTIKRFSPDSYQPEIVAGTFEMEAVNGQGKVIHITDGRFDIIPY